MGGGESKGATSCSRIAACCVSRSEVEGDGDGDGNGNGECGKREPPEPREPRPVWPAHQGNKL